MAIYAKIKGAIQGDLTGAVAAGAFSGQIQVDTVQVGVGSHTDVATGQSTGKRVARPLVITKPMDQSSPLLHRACTTNEVLTRVDLSYVVEGHGHTAFATVKLTNAVLRDYNQEASAGGTFTEKLSFTYTKIEFTWVKGGIVSEDDWTSSS